VTIIREDTTQGAEPEHFVTVIKATGCRFALNSDKRSIQFFICNKKSI
jgi:hypothetical protein